MNRRIGLLLLICGLNLTSLPPVGAVATCAEGGQCIVGDTGPGGGLVFFVKATGSFSASYTVPGGFMPQTYSVSLTSDQQAALNFDYLEVAPTGRGAGIWGVAGATTGGTSLLIGGGKTNTENILLTQVGPAADNAARYADEYTNNGKTDWYLPSYHELLLIMLRVKLAASNFTAETFPLGLWASSDGGDLTTAYYSALGQLQGNVNRSANTPGVRAVRAFSATPEVTPDPSVDLAALQAKREREIRENKKVLVEKISRGEKPPLDLYRASDLSAVNNKNFDAISAELINLPVESRSEFSNVAKVIRKFEVIEKLSDPAKTRSVYPKDLIEIGLVDPKQVQKMWITSQLRAELTSSSLTFAQLKESLEKYNAVIQARKDRMAAMKKRLQERLIGLEP